MSLKDMRQLSKEERKNKIRERYKGVDPDLLETLPPDEDFIDEVPNIRRETLRVAIYVRVSTDDENQTSSFVRKELFAHQRDPAVVIRSRQHHI